MVKWQVGKCSMASKCLVTGDSVKNASRIPRAKARGSVIKRVSVYALPAPVVPPALVDARTPGLCRIVTSRPARDTSTVCAAASTKPRFCEPTSFEYRSNVSRSAVPVSVYWVIEGKHISIITAISILDLVFQMRSEVLQGHCGVFWRAVVEER